MTELKTLKDLKKEYIEQPIEPVSEKDKQELKRERFEGKLIGFTCVSDDDLKQEAIKWIEHIQVEVKQISDLCFEAREKRDVMKIMATQGLDKELEAQIVWIKMFFNITEKELK